MYLAAVTSSAQAVQFYRDNKIAQPTIAQIAQAAGKDAQSRAEIAQLTIGAAAVAGGLVLTPALSAVAAEVLAFAKNPVTYCTANPMGCLAAVDISASVATGAVVPGMVPVGAVTNPARTTVKTAGAAVEEMGAAAKVASVEAKGGVAAAEETAGSIRNVNPGYPTTGRTQNCVNCTVATDATLSGSPATALPSSGPVSIRVLEQQYGGRFGAPTTSGSIEQQLLSAGDGARGIVFGSRGPNEAGHVFNVVNQNGVVRFLDGQSGQPASFGDYQSFHLLRTNKP